MDSKLEFLLENAPNVHGNSFFAGLIRILSVLLGLGLIIIGLSLLIAKPVEKEIVNYLIDPGVKPSENFQNQVNLLTTAMGFISVLIGVILMILRNMAGQVLYRNSYINLLREYYQGELEKREQQEDS